MSVRFVFVNYNNKYISHAFLTFKKYIMSISFLCKVFKNDNDDVLCIIVFRNTILVFKRSS